MANRKKQESAAEKIDRARAASDRARQRLADSGAPSEPQIIDIARAPLSWWQERWHDKAIRRQFIENFIYIRDAFDENKLTLMKLNDFQADLHEKVTGKDAIVKFRRGGSSSYWKAADFADAIVVPGSNVRMVPQDPDTEEAFRADLKIMYENLPEHLKPGVRQWTDKLIWLANDSRIVSATVQPGHEQKGRGQTITRLFLTEVPFWRGNQRKAATALIEAAAGGQVAVESTPFGVEWFHSIYLDGKAGKGGWTSHFYEWWWNRNYQREGAQIVRLHKEWLLLEPGQSLEEIAFPSKGTGAEKLEAYRRIKGATLSIEERVVAVKILRHLQKLGYVKQRTKWCCPEVAAFIAWRRAKIEELPGGEDQFKVEYPENDHDCFEQTGRPVIPAKFLKVTCEPSSAIEGHRYVVSADPSLGLESGDPAAIAVIDVDNGAMAKLEKLKVPPDMLALRLADLSDEYNGAVIAVERNSIGIATIRKLLEMGYEDRVYKHLDARLRRAVDAGKLSLEEAMEQAQPGFPTSAETKPVGAMMLEEGIRKGQLGISSQEFCEEARTVVWFDNGTFGALPGYHDDQFMAVMIGWYVIRLTLGIFTGFIGLLPEFGDAR
jgi:hypothetical protein